MIKKVKFLFFIFLILGIVVMSSEQIFAEKIDEKVIGKLEKNNYINVFIQYSDKIKKGFLNEEKNSILEKEKIRHEFNEGISAKISKSDLKKLKTNANVESITLVGTKRIFLEDSIPLVNATNSWNTQIYGVNLTGEGETICILDTGADFTHPDLQNKNLTCVVDCISDSCIPNCSVGDDNGHGTHVAGIVAANGNLKGVAPDANLIGVKVCDAEGSCSEDDILAGIDWCIGNQDTYNISIISMSLGGGQYSDYCDNEPGESVFASSINNAISKNISVVVATGNTNEVFTNATAGIASPACIENATRVTATSKSDNLASFAFRHEFFTDILTAPGVSINSTYLDNSYSINSGTSMSAPHVSGAFAIINQFKRLELNKTLTPLEITSSLNNSGKKVFDSSTGKNFSRIDVYSSILSLDEVPPEINLISPLNLTLEPSNYTFSCNATDFLQLSNLTLTIWNSSAIYFQNTTNAVLNSLTIEENVTLLSDEYTWSCEASDQLGNFAISSNQTIITFLTTIQLSPENNTKTNQNFLFECSSFSTGELSNITFSLWNSSELEHSETKNISGNSNSTEFEYSFNEEGLYFWNCLVFDTEGNSSLSSNFSINYDLTEPVVSLTSPENAHSTTTNSINFQYEVTEEVGTQSCSLLIDNEIVESNQSEIINSTNTISHSLSVGSYEWKVSCIDEAGNTGNSSSRTLTMRSPSSGGGGGGTSSSSQNIPTDTTIKINLSSEELEKGITKIFNKSRKITFEYLSKTYELSINSIGNNEVNFLIQNHSSFTIKINEIKKLNLNKDDFYDLEIIVLNVSEKEAEIFLRRLNEEINSKTVFEEEPTEEEVGEKNKSFFSLIADFFKNLFRKIFGRFLNLLLV
ncbi:MAG: S8 family serine peptidase [Nanoarchaeota archaeon]|nr:S8 family serine peptidase [Nanoarchaeota archaeon]